MKKNLSFKDSALRAFGKGKYAEALKYAAIENELYPILFKYYDYVPDNKKRAFCLRAYMDDGFKYPVVRKAVRSSLRYGRPVLPAEIASEKELTVYRAADEPIEKAKYRLSWTLHPSTTKRFLEELHHKNATRIFRGKIKVNKIIAYNNIRGESEIIQYRNVYDIEDVTDKIISEV